MEESSVNTPDLQKHIEILESVSIFKETTPEIRSELANSMQVIHLEKGEVVFHKGDQLHAMYIIVDGKVKVHDGDYEFTTFGNNQYFGEYSLIDSSVRSATVTTLKATKLLKLDKETFDHIISKNTDIARAILKSLISRLRNNNILEEQLTQQSQELKREKRALEEKREELEELNATKDKFFSIIAHDLKNPFNTIIGLSELLLFRYDSYDDEKIKEFVEQINDFSSNAYNLLDNLLQWARSQTNRIKVNPGNIDLESIVNENYMLLKNSFEEKSIRLFRNLKASDPCYADRNMISTVIRNLLSNAVKFTPDEGRVAINTSDYKNGYVKVSVVDNGTGISQEDLPKLFQLTSNFSKEGTRSEKGTGLGLILCKEFVEKNGGVIWAESETGKGSSFNFTLPKASNH